MATLNEVRLIGRFLADPEPARSLGSGSTVVSFRFVVGRSKKNKDGQWENDPNPLYIDCDAWDKTADLVARFCARGKQVYLAGRLKTDAWDDKATGARRSKIKMVVSHLEFLDSAGSDPPDTNSHEQTQTPYIPDYPVKNPAEVVENDEDIPF